MKSVTIAVLLGFLAAGGLRAESIKEETAVGWLAERKPLWLSTTAKSTPAARAIIHFWVGKDGNVEAVEQDCGELELFNDIVDRILQWKFHMPEDPHSFSTDLSFVRRGRRVRLVQELPTPQRPKGAVCRGK